MTKQLTIEIDASNGASDHSNMFSEYRCAYAPSCSASHKVSRRSPAAHALVVDQHDRVLTIVLNGRVDHKVHFVLHRHPDRCGKSDAVGRASHLRQHVLRLALVHTVQVAVANGLILHESSIDSLNMLPRSDAPLEVLISGINGLVRLPHTTNHKLSTQVLHGSSYLGRISTYRTHRHIRARAALASLSSSEYLCILGNNRCETFTSAART